ncbi:uncharacterized protein EV422DRAFT_503622 [Fimicolochytrium jonesii]|uniref:uncharacterized protein n=1 Tax=Fimicolochytrium jonesii TaxID=1396493 RepID=UPI0022FED6AC|nr:uncharacterized protein EV422DRAFT_503622 [Fimicolochytrium jonesii]KAI8824814.1 hypothetical protein EV422DRAFT_503622 [Fimicolochytrium jonesii]
MPDVITEATLKAHTKLCPKLPLELIPHVFSFVDSCTGYNMVSVSRSWHGILAKLLYSKVSIVGEHRFNLLFATLNDNLERFRWIKDIQMEAYCRNSVNGETAYAEQWSPVAFSRLSALLAMSRPGRASFTIYCLNAGGDLDMFFCRWDRRELTFEMQAFVPEDFQEEVIAFAQTLAWTYADETRSLQSLGGSFHKLPYFKALRTVTLRSDLLVGDPGQGWSPSRSLDQVRLTAYEEDDWLRIVPRLPQWTRSLDVCFMDDRMKLPPWPSSSRIQSGVLRYSPSLFLHSFDPDDWRAELSSYDGGGTLEIMYRADVMTTDYYRVVMRPNDYYKIIDAYVELAVESKKFDEPARKLAPSISSKAPFHGLGNVVLEDHGKAPARSICSP